MTGSSLVSTVHRSLRVTAAACLVVSLGCTEPPKPDDEGPARFEKPPADVPFRVEDPNWKQLFTATSTDGLHWETSKTPLAVSASSPQLVRVGRHLRVYFVDHGESLAWLPFEGGATTPVVIEGLGEGLQVDPCVSPTADGGLRLYFIHHPSEADPGLSPHNSIVSAVSDNGKSWTLEPGLRMEGGYVDPDVVELPEGGQRMYLTRSTHEVTSALSADGLSFELEDGLRFEGGGVTSTLLTTDGWMMFFHREGTLGRVRSRKGLRFDGYQRLDIAAPEGGPWMLEAPSVLWHEDRLLMVYVLAPTSAEQVF
mgnify:CR=1 FL=1